MGSPGRRRRAGVLALSLVVAAAACGGSGSPASGGLVPIGVGLSGPQGLRATVYSRGLTHASAFAFDPSGRLWVATADYTDQGRDGVYVVPKAGAQPVEVLAGVHTPLGLLWYDGALYVSSRERVDVYRGFDGERFASSQKIVTLPAGVGEVNGITAAPDGRLVLGISAPCDHCTPTNALSASVVSFRPDGSDLRVLASGIRAPVGLAYFPATDDLLVTMNQRDDLGAQTPGDWLSIVETGQNWHFPGCYGQGGSACAGAPSPVAVLDKHAAVSGVAIVTGQLGATVGTGAVVAEWNSGRVEFVSLTRSGSMGRVSTFLTGIQNPEPVVLTPTGHVLVGDWTSGVVYDIAPAAASG